MNKETFERSANLVSGVAYEIWEYLSGKYPDDWDLNDLIDSCDSAIQEINSWKDKIKSKQKFEQEEDLK